MIFKSAALSASRVILLEKGLQTSFATVLGAILLLIGIIGFVNDPVLGIFSVNGLHNLVHLLSGAIGIIVGVWGGIVASRWYNRIFGIVYGLVAILGLLNVQWFIDLLDVNNADDWLHVLIAVASLAVGFSRKD